jgi:hypothetical protein
VNTSVNETLSEEGVKTNFPLEQAPKLTKEWRQEDITAHLRYGLFSQWGNERDPNTSICHISSRNPSLSLCCSRAS